MSISIKDMRVATICEEIEKGWPDIYGATWLGYGSVVDIWRVNRTGRLTFINGLMRVDTILYDIEFKNNQPDGLAEFSNEVIEFLNKERPYLSSDSEHSIGPMSYHCVHIDRMKQNPPEESSKLIVIGVTFIPVIEFENQTDLIKTALNIFHLLEHPAGWDSWDKLKEQVVCTNWDLDTSEQG